MSGTLDAVRRRHKESQGQKLGVYKDTTVTPYDIKSLGKWRVVCQRPNGSYFITTPEGEITIPQDVRMVLGGLARRNADSGRKLNRPGRSQAMGSTELKHARITAQAQIELYKQSKEPEQ